MPKNFYFSSWSLTSFQFLLFNFSIVDSRNMLIYKLFFMLLSVFFYCLILTIPWFLLLSSFMLLTPILFKLFQKHWTLPCFWGNTDKIAMEMACAWLTRLVNWDLGILWRRYDGVIEMVLSLECYGNTSVGTTFGLISVMNWKVLQPFCFYWSLLVFMWKFLCVMWWFMNVCLNNDLKK